MSLRCCRAGVLTIPLLLNLLNGTTAGSHLNGSLHILKDIFKVKYYERKTYKVDLLPEDFIGTTFTSFTDCPLARAIKRHFSLHETYVNFKQIWKTVDDRGNHDMEIVKPEVEWNHEICEKVAECYKDSDHDTIYYVTLKEI